jgi:CPA1 family monovalent cation:H+ antiporter
VVTILEGESLVNDATALVLYRAAVGAAVTGSFTWGGAVLDFVLAASLGVAVGIAVAWLTRWALCATEDSFTQIGITLLAPYLAWVAGESVHASAVLACVAGGIHLRQHFSGAVSPTTRIQARAVWDLLVFLLNGIIFILIGLQLGALRHAIPADRFGSLVAAGLVISLTAIAVRLLWVPLAAIIPRLLMPSLRRRDPLPPWSGLFLIAWTGMRGIVTLAAAMALPVTVAAGTPFPFRAEIVLISFAVILITLVGQGLSLPPILRLLPQGDDDRAMEDEERSAREHAAIAALARLDELAGEDWLRPEQVDRLRVHYSRRVERFASHGNGDPECSADASRSFQQLRHETLSAERTALINLRNDGTISDEVMHRLEHELDVEALRTGIGERRIERRAERSSLSPTSGS